MIYISSSETSWQDLEVGKPLRGNIRNAAGSEMRSLGLCRAVAKVFKGKLGQDKAKIEKGVAFPTCCSVNKCAFSALL